MIKIIRLAPYLILLGAGFLNSCRKEKPTAALSDNSAAAADTKPQKASPANLAPNLLLPRFDGGREWELAPFLGEKPVLIAFFTTWCPYCNRSMPYLTELYEKGRSQNLEIAAIDIEEEPDKVAAFVKKFGLQFPVLLAQDQRAFADRYPVRYLPTLYLIGRDGSLLKKYEGFHPSVVDEITELIGK